MSDKQVLLRLHSAERGIFDCSFSQPIEVGKDTSIALKSLNFFTGDKSFSIDSSNNLVQFKVSDVNADGVGGLRNINLESRTVGTDFVSPMDSLVELITELEDKMSQSLSINNFQELGMGCRVDLEQKSQKFHIEYKFFGLLNLPATNPDNQQISDDPYYQNPVVVNAGQNEKNINEVLSVNNGGQDIFHVLSGRVPSVGPAINRNFVYNDLPININGASTISLNLNFFQNADGNTSAGAFIGFVKTTHKNKLLNDDNNPERAPRLEVADFKYLLRTNVDNLHASKYQFFVDGFETADAGIADVIPHRVNFKSNTWPASDPTNTDTDILQLRINKGRIQAVVFQNESGEYEDKFIGSGGQKFPYSYENDYVDLGEYYMVAGVIGNNDTTQIYDLMYTPDPFLAPTPQNYFGNNLGIKKSNRHLTGVPIVVHPDIEPVAFNFIFDSIDLANNMGFNNQNQNPNGELGTSSSILADNDIATILNTNTYLLQLLNLKIDSFDSRPAGANSIHALGSRQNILDAVIVPQSLDNGGRHVVYNPSIIFYNLDNKEKLSLRNIRMRLVDGNYAEVPLVGNPEATLLLKWKE